MHSVVRLQKPTRASAAESHADVHDVIWDHRDQCCDRVAREQITRSRGTLRQAAQIVRFHTECLARNLHGRFGWTWSLH